MRFPFNLAVTPTARSLALLSALTAGVSPSALPAPRSAALPLEAACTPTFDCNDNGVEDAIDIAVGSSGDANNNGVPDECEGRARE